MRIQNIVCLPESRQAMNQKLIQTLWHQKRGGGGGGGGGGGRVCGKKKAEGHNCSSPFGKRQNKKKKKPMVELIPPASNTISMGECNTILSAYTKYRHLG